MILIIGLALLFGTAALVVFGAQYASRRMPTNEIEVARNRATAPPNYDNRWPGYPARAGDAGYDPLFKGACSGLPALQYDATTPKGVPLWKPIGDDD